MCVFDVGFRLPVDCNRCDGKTENCVYIYIRADPIRGQFASVDCSCSVFRVAVWFSCDDGACLGGGGGGVGD